MFVWIARDKFRNSLELGLYSKEPENFCDQWECEKIGSFTQYLRAGQFPQIKPGECRKFKLVEVDK